jgi:RNA polymerase sigma-70 factor, ECF subfamily
VEPRGVPSTCLKASSVAVGAGFGEHETEGSAVAETSTAARALRLWRAPLTRHSGLGEAALIRAAQRGSEEAVERLFERHWTAAYRTALMVTGDRAAAEDIAQEAFLAAVRALPRFDLRRPIEPWLHRIVVNRAIDFSRARALRREVGPCAAPDTPAPDSDTQSGLGEGVAEALARLAPEQRAVIVLRYLLDLTPGEIAAALDLPRGTVNSCLRRGLDAMGVLIEGKRR